MPRKRVVWFTLIVILLLVGCKAYENDHDKGDLGVIDRVVNLQKYLITNIGSIGFGGVVSCRYEPLNAEQGVDGKIYLWVICLEYYLDGENLTLGTGASLPVVLEIQQKNNIYEIVGHQTPRDGNDNAQDVYALFPESAWAQIFHDDSEFNDRIGELAQDLEERAILSFRD